MRDDHGYIFHGTQTDQDKWDMEYIMKTEDKISKIMHWNWPWLSKCDVLRDFIEKGKNGK